MFPILGAKRIFLENPGLSRTSYRFLAPCQNLEKTNDTIPRKRLDRSTDGRTNRPYFTATTQNNIPLKITRQSAEVTANTLQSLFNNAISNSEFPENLKLANITPLFKKKDPLDKTSYRPVSVWLRFHKFLKG